MFYLSFCNAWFLGEEILYFSEIGDPGNWLLWFLKSLGVGGGVLRLGLHE